MKLLNELIKPSIHKILDKAGYELHYTGKLGWKAHHDIEALFAATNDDVNVIFDVGANVGQSALKFSASFPTARIYSFEPFQTAYNSLRENTKHVEQIQPYNLAFGSTEEVMEMYVYENSVGNSLLPISETKSKYINGDWANWTKQIGSTQVEVTSLDFFCQKHNVRSLDILKIDTQGYEAQVLDGAKKMLDSNSIKAIFLEVAFTSIYQGQVNFEDLYVKLKSHNFHLVDFYEKARNTYGHIMWCDALFIAE